MLQFCEKLTLGPSTIAESDVDALRDAGFSDGDIVAITAAAAYRNFIIRVADGLGVELDATRSGYYDPHVLRAFGVTERAVGGTLYADRQSTSGDAVDSPRRAGADPAARRAQNPGAPRTPDGRACWIAGAVDGSRHASLAGQAARARTAGTPGSLRAPGTPENLMTALALKPETLAATLAFARLVDAGGSSLGGRLEAILGAVVAAVLGLSYLTTHHGQRLRAAGAPAELRAVVDDPGGGSLAGAEREAARFAAKLTRAPGTMARADVEALRAAGFDDRDIVTIVGAVAFANYRGLIAAALGVQPEEAAPCRSA
jgi:uncharacterized peroxidase-related enzyme